MMNLLLSAGSGALIVAGALTAYASLLSTNAPRPTRRWLSIGSIRRRRAPSAMSSNNRRARRWTFALGAGLLGWIVTSWPAVGLIVAAAVFGLPVWLQTGRMQGQAIARVEALEEWTRRLSDILIAGSGLEQAIAGSLRICPPLITDEVGALAARLAARWSTEDALRAFADDLDDASGDLIVCALILNSRRRGPGIARILAGVADTVADEVAVRRKIEAERAKPRATARAITGITFVVVCVGALNGTYLKPYGEPMGQAVLALIALAFIGCLAWMRALTIAPREPRIIGREVEEIDSGPVVAAR